MEVPLSDRASVRDHDDLVGQSLDLIEDVGAHKDVATGLLQSAQRHDLDEIADMQAGRGAVEPDIGGDLLLLEKRVERATVRATIIRPAGYERAEESGAESWRGARHGDFS
jgi:hypothetical protein